MNPEEYYALYKVEKEHWFYSGKRLIVQKWLDKLGYLRTDNLLLDIGSGTGLFAEDMSKNMNVVALDQDANSLGLLRKRKHILPCAGNAETLPIASASICVVSALDVIEHVDDDHAALQEFKRILQPGGLIILTVPAFMSLWSDWDVSLHHRRRYTLKLLTSSWEGLDLEVLHLSYINTLAYIPIFLLRQARKWSISSPSQANRAEDWIPNNLLNNLLRALFVQPALWPVRWPFGVSCFAILRKRKQA